jgi:hypothetical protein
MNYSPRFNYHGIPGKGFMWSDNDGISWAVLAEKAKIDKNDAVALIELVRQTYSPERRFLALIDVRAADSISDEARTIGVNKEFSDMIAAMAIVVESGSTRIMANFFIRFNPPTIPTRIFTTPEAAKNWLMGYK